MPNLRKVDIILISMGNLVIFGAWLLINCMVNVTETFTDILKHYFLQMNVVKFAKCKLQRVTLNCTYSIYHWLYTIHLIKRKYMENDCLLWSWYVPEHTDKTTRGCITQRNFCLIKQSVTGEPNLQLHSSYKCTLDNEEMISYNQNQKEINDQCP